MWNRALTGTEDGKKRYGTVEMRRVNGVWGGGKESWSDTPPKK